MITTIGLLTAICALCLIGCWAGVYFTAQSAKEVGKLLSVHQDLAQHIGAEAEAKLAERRARQVELIEQVKSIDGKV